MQELLASGGGDGTLRLWDPLTGRLLDTLQLPPVGGGGGQEQQQEQQQEQGAEADADGDDDEAAVPLALAASPCGGWLMPASTRRLKR